MKSLILYLFLLVFEDLFNFFPDFVHKRGRLSITFLEKSFKFNAYSKNSLVFFKHKLMLLLLKADFFQKKTKL